MRAEGRQEHIPRQTLVLFSTESSIVICTSMEVVLLLKFMAKINQPAAGNVVKYFWITTVFAVPLSPTKRTAFPAYKRRKFHSNLPSVTA